MTQKLIDGFLDFRAGAYDSAESAMRDLVKLGQSPDYFIISCIDSRGNPGTIFKPAPGTFFAHKAMGAIVRPYKKGTALAAALQFALEYNKVGKIIILGHTGCGAVKALVEGMPDEEISSFVEVARAGLDKAKALASDEETHDDLYRHAEEQIVLQSAENLKSYPSVAKALRENRVTITAWLFDMHEGDLLEYAPDKNEFVSLITPDMKKKRHA
jgi:carbonic anhydrase